MRFTLSIAVAIALLGAWSAAADAQSNDTPAVALVLEVRGDTDPALKPYRELRVGDKVNLGRSGKLVVLFYDRECKTITIEGGTVVFPRRGEPVVKDGVASAKDGKCLRRLEARSTAGAIVMRGPATKVALTPAFLVGGARAGDVGALRVLDDDKKSVFESPVNGTQFQWPAGAPALAKDRHYTIEFLAKGSNRAMGSAIVYTGELTPEEASAQALIVID